MLGYVRLSEKVRTDPSVLKDPVSTCQQVRGQALGLLCWRGTLSIDGARKLTCLRISMVISILGWLFQGLNVGRRSLYSSPT